MRRFLLPTSLLVALVAPLIIAQPVHATDPMPAVAAGEGMGNMWAAVKIPAGVHHVVIDWFVQNMTPSFYLAWSNFYYDEQGELIDREGLSGAATDEVFVHLQGEGLPDVHEEIFVHPGGWSKGRTTLGCPTCPPTTKAFTFVTVTAPATGPWNFTVRTEDPGEFPADWGNTTFLYRSRDFSGDLNAQISPGILVRANVDTSLTIQSEDTLIGWYRPTGGHPTPSQMSVDTPSGAVACPCDFFQHAAGPDSWGPGAYRFHLTEADIDTEVLLFGASIRLPP